MLRNVARALVPLLLAVGGCAPVSRASGADSASAARPAARGVAAPLVDHHQHRFSPAIVALVGTPAGGLQPVATHDLVALLDSAGIRRAAVLSVAYLYGSPARSVEDEYAKVRAENDWTAAQVARYPDRLRALCGVNPLKEYALDELARCARDPRLRHGVKLHFGNSDVQLDDPAHVEQVGRVFRAANGHRMAIVLHLRANTTRRRPYGAAQARAFLERLLPLAPDVPVQVAHLAGTGPGYVDPPSDSAMAFLAEAVARRDPRTRLLWFDVASGGNLLPRESWAAFRRVPLTDDELARIASNVAPYLR